MTRCDVLPIGQGCTCHPVSGDSVARVWADLRAGRITVEQGRERNRALKLALGTDGFTRSTVPDDDDRIIVGLALA